MSASGRPVRCRRAALGAVIVSIGVVAGAPALAPAAAAKPRKGQYQCYYYAPSIPPNFVGTLILKADNRYRVKGSPQVGKYSYNDPKLKFKTGAWKGWTGKYEKDDDGDYVLTVYDDDKEYLATCAHD